jgi:hypothetical protein
MAAGCDVELSTICASSRHTLHHCTRAMADGTTGYLIESEKRVEESEKRASREWKRVEESEKRVRTEWKKVQQMPIGSEGSSGSEVSKKQWRSKAKRVKRVEESEK